MHPVISDQLFMAGCCSGLRLFLPCVCLSGKIVQFQALFKTSLSLSFCALDSKPSATSKISPGEHRITDCLEYHQFIKVRSVVSLCKNICWQSNSVLHES